MRKADFDRAWVECRKAERPTIDVKELVVSVAGVETSLPISSRILAVVGANGVGKTTFIHAMRDIASGGPVPPWAPHDVMKLKGVFRGQQFSMPADGPDSPASPDIESVDPSYELHIFQNYIRSATNIDEILPQVGAAIVKSAELNLYRYSVRKVYSAIKVYEIESPLDPDEVFPYFEVESAVGNYNSKAMGFGELSACYIVWRCLRAQKGSILLFDEPDSHLSPRSRIALINLFAYIAAERSLQIIFTSHSSETVTTLNPDEVILIDPTMGAALTISPLKRRALRRLGLIAVPRILVVCEDVDGKEALLCLLSKWAMEFSDIIDVQVMLGGASELVRLQRLFPGDSRVCRLQVVLDGDKRGLYAETPGILFLVGDLDPVASARSVVRNDPTFFAGQLGVTIVDAAMAIAATDYLDHHDFCTGLSEQLHMQGVDTKRVRLALFRAWADDEAQHASGKILVDALLSLAAVEIGT